MRRTIVVHTKLSGHMIRVDAARSGDNGVQIMTMGQLAGRLAGGFLQPIDPENLQEAVRMALAGSSLVEFEAIKDLPGIVRVAANTLDKVWRADIDLSAAIDPRLMALRVLENETLRRLPPSMKRPKELVELACGRIRHAPAVIGPVEIHGHSEMSPCWRPLLVALTTTVPVVQPIPNCRLRESESICRWVAARLRCPHAVRRQCSARRYRPRHLWPRNEVRIIES